MNLSWASLLLSCGLENMDNPLRGKKGSWVFLTEGLCMPSLSTFFRGQWDYSEGYTRRWTWNPVRFEGLCPPYDGLGRHTRVPSTGWEWSWAETLGYKVLPS